MAPVRFSPEGVQSLGKLPFAVLERFNATFSVIAQSGPSTLPSTRINSLEAGDCGH
jgi:hypothetical protein